ncbi:MAG: hypothetical protein FJZ09_04280 [Candidatus Omnitrophica bacterium]|nr:hypothetical protein [Candidatus Omnitrophota bacterium]
MNKKGSVLIISLWIVAILAVFAIGLAHRGALNLRLARYQRDRLAAGLMARAGINKSVTLADKDGADPNTMGYDTVGECGVNLRGKSPSDYFHQLLGDSGAFFDIGYSGPQGAFTYGMLDEESKININGSSDFEKKKAYCILNARGVTDAAQLSEAIIDWMNPASTLVYAKKEPLKMPEELLLALENYFRETKGYSDAESGKRARQAYADIESLFTIYGDAKLNINTATDETIGIYVQAVALNSGLTADVADSITNKLISLGNSGPIKEDTALILDGLTPDESGLFNQLKNTLKIRSDCLRIDSTGRSRGSSKKITAVYDRANAKFLYWREN